MNNFEIFSRIVNEQLYIQREEKIETKAAVSPEPEEDRKTGPILEVNGVESRWGSRTRDPTRDPTMIRILFNTDAGVISNQHINLKNTGTTAIFYAWKVRMIGFFIHFRRNSIRQTKDSLSICNLNFFSFCQKRTSSIQ